LLCHCELQEHAPDLLASPLVGEAQEARAAMSTINPDGFTVLCRLTGLSESNPTP
jgi:hypothetical protein